MLEARKAHYDELDHFAKHVSTMSLADTEMSEALLSVIIDLYKSAKVETEYHSEWFDTAYHSPVTGELEFIIARILLHYSQTKGKGWKILLRRQVKKTAPDIRIEVGGRTLAVIEVKAKVGWVQPFFSSHRYQRDLERMRIGESEYNPDEVIVRSRAQLEKYEATFQISKDDIFLFLPTLAMVHRKKYETTVAQYCDYFASTSRLCSSNLILLSANLNLDLSKGRGDLMPTNNFERMLRILDERT